MKWCLCVSVWLTKDIYKRIFTKQASHDVLSLDVLGKEINSNRTPEINLILNFLSQEKEWQKEKQKRSICS